jgi:hypothetical protein
MEFILKLRISYHMPTLIFWYLVISGDMPNNMKSSMSFYFISFDASLLSQTRIHRPSSVDICHGDGRMGGSFLGKRKELVEDSQEAASPPHNMQPGGPHATRGPPHSVGMAVRARRTSLRSSSQGATLKKELICLGKKIR